MDILTINDFNALEKLKEEIFNAYNTIIDEPNRNELFNSFSCVKQCKAILEKIYLRICKNFNVTKSITKVNFNCLDFFETINNHDITNNDIELGNYINDEIMLNVVVNCDTKNLDNYNINAINNYKIASKSKNWTVNMLETFLHESFHSMQEELEFEESQHKGLNFNDLSNPAKQYRVDVTTKQDYNPQKNAKLYLGKIMEISARQFALEEIYNFYKSKDVKISKNIKNQIADFLNYKILTETTTMLYENKDILDIAKNKYLLICHDVNYINFINNYYKNIKQYYNKLNTKCNEITKNISKIIDTKNFRLAPKELYALYKDTFNRETISHIREYFSQILGNF